MKKKLGEVGEAMKSGVEKIGDAIHKGFNWLKNMVQPNKTVTEEDRGTRQRRQIYFY